MSRRVWVAGIGVLFGGACAVGPSYREPAIAPAGTAVGLSPRPDSIRAFSTRSPRSIPLRPGPRRPWRSTPPTSPGSRFSRIPPC